MAFHTTSHGRSEFQQGISEIFLSLAQFLASHIILQVLRKKCVEPNRNLFLKGFQKILTFFWHVFFLHFAEAEEHLAEMTENWILLFSQFPAVLLLGAKQLAWPEDPYNSTVLEENRCLFMMR